MKLYDGRDKRFKKLIDPKEIMKENRLKLTEVLPKHARPKWIAMWFRWGIAIALAVGLLNLSVDVIRLIMYDEHPVYTGDVDFIAGALSIGVFFGGLTVLSERKWTWRSKAVAIRTLAQLGFCPNCGYIIRDTPTELDGCVPCSECGYAWRVEPVDS